jgi:hypothetical protein
MANPREPAWNCKVKSGNLMARVLKHAHGEIEMTPTQLRAAEIYLKKTIPDVARTELTGKDGGAVETKDVTKSDAEILAQYLGKK